MGKKNSKLKQETIDALIKDTYCESVFLPVSIFFFFFLHAACTVFRLCAGI